MPRMSRIVAVDYPHHLTQRGVRSIDIFHGDNDRNQYLQFIKEESQRCEIEILAWCLMTNQVHFIAVPHAETSFARGFGEAHKRYTRMKNFSDNVRTNSGDVTPISLSRFNRRTLEPAKGLVHSWPLQYYLQ